LLGQQTGSFKREWITPSLGGHQVAAIFSGGASTTVKSRIGRWGVVHGGRHILVKRLGFCCGAAAGAAGQNPHDSNSAFLGKGQNVPLPHGPCGLWGRRSVHPDMPGADCASADAARFKESRLPQPFV
jgi:hypothetical protein